MVQLEKYKELMREAMCAVAAEVPKVEGIRTEVVCDDALGHYEVMEIGWLGPSRIHGTLVHCDIYNDKIYVEHNGTDMDITEIFLKAGVPYSDIVLAFKHPEIRPYTDFAVA